MDIRNSAQSILFIDDEEGVRRSVQRALKREPYHIYTAGDGREGLIATATLPWKDWRTSPRHPMSFVKPGWDCVPETWQADAGLRSLKYRFLCSSESEWL